MWDVADSLRDRVSDSVCSCRARDCSQSPCLSRALHHALHRSRCWLSARKSQVTPRYLVYGSNRLGGGATTVSHRNPMELAESEQSSWFYIGGIVLAFAVKAGTFPSDSEVAAHGQVLMTPPVPI